MSMNLKILKKQFITAAKITLSAAFLVALIFVALSFFFLQKYKNRIYPNTYIAGLNVSNLSKTEAEKKLESKTSEISKLTFINGAESYQIPLENVSFKYDLDKTLDKAFQINRRVSWLTVLPNLIKSYNSETKILLDINLSNDNLKDLILITLSDIPTDAAYPKLTLKGGEIIPSNGTPGKTIDFKTLTDTLFTHIVNADYRPISINVNEVNNVLSTNELQEFKDKGDIFLGKKIIITGPNYFKYELKDSDILKTISPQGYYDEELNSLALSVKSKADRNPENSIFKEEQGKVLEFKVSRNGVSVQTEELAANLKDSIEKLKNENKIVEMDVPYKETVPEITTEKVNNLGIKELLGTGYSEFAHSIPSRIHNVGLASSKFNGVLVPPGETFSFNKTLGDVSKYTGYQQAYVIRDGRTILGDGGGVCQVSTTLFRALLNSGLPITERAAHSYRVSYYEQNSPAGMDATVYSPSPDLKFTNDTPGSILIQSIFNGDEKKLVFELYGTSDGRKATVSAPKTLSQTNPPDDIYIDDPTLPAGKVIQEEHKAWGAKIVFNYKVERGGEILIERDFVSNYRPWASVYRRGTAPTI